MMSGGIQSFPRSDGHQATFSTSFSHSCSYPSQHVVSKAESIADNPYFVDEPGSERRGVDVGYYTLVDIVERMGLNFDALQTKLLNDGHTPLNDHIARECIEAICNQINPNYVVKARYPTYIYCL